MIGVVHEDGLADGMVSGGRECFVVIRHPFDDREPDDRNEENGQYAKNSPDTLIVMDRCTGRRVFVHFYKLVFETPGR